MWSAKPPVSSAMETTKACIRGTKNRELRTRLSSELGQIERNSHRLQDAAKRHELYTIDSASYFLSNVSDAEIKAIYNRQLGRNSSRPASLIRDQLIGSAANGLCCYCQYGLATTLDHFVPKDLVAALAIDPWNLVPACSRCNHKLHATYGNVPTKQMLHPYSMPPIGRWLHAQAQPSDPVSLSFSANPDSLLDSELRERVVNEFASLDLGNLFAIISGVDVSQINSTLTRQFPDANALLVKSHLTEAASDAFRVEPNSRRGVIYEALADADWYCQGAYMGNAKRVATP